MAKITLGKTGITVNKMGFGALPVQRVGETDAAKLLRRAYDGGFRFFDTAHFYTDSEHKIGVALEEVRDSIVLATKTAAQTPEVFWKELDQSLKEMKTDYIDLYQFHNPSWCPKPGDGTGVYECMLEAKHRGKIRHIGITNHRLAVAHEAVESGLYETLQFPFSYLSGAKELELAAACKAADMGFIAMKALSGGLISHSRAACAYLSQEEFSHVLPIWGIQKEKELDEFLEYTDKLPELTPELDDVIRFDREQLQGDFCRGCGYCMPCPAGIEINNCARMSLMIRRAPSAAQLTEEMQAKMLRIENCLNCGLCRQKCPYELDTPALLKKNLQDYKQILEGKVY